MAWDKAGEDHTGESLFGLIPTDERGRSGILLRDQGYAEKAPASSEFSMDDRDGLLLSTGYETMSVWERFSFSGPNVRVRSSTVEGLSNNASFCVEIRCDEETVAPPDSKCLLTVPPTCLLTNAHHCWRSSARWCSVIQMMSS